MDVWTCPKCQRNFGKKRLSHRCSPGLSLDDYFDGAAPWEEPIFKLIRDHIATLGPVIIDPLQMGIMFKNGPMFLELRAMKKWVAVGFSLGNPNHVRPGSDPMVPDDIDDDFFHG